MFLIDVPKDDITPSLMSLNQEDEKLLQNNCFYCQGLKL